MYVVVSDFSDNKETVEVGVIVMGLCCMCLVACALVILQLRSNNRRITGNRPRPGSADNRSNDRTRDPLDTEAPPSYDAGMLIDSFNLSFFISVDLTSTLFSLCPDALSLLFLLQNFNRLGVLARATMGARGFSWAVSG